MSYESEFDEVKTTKSEESITVLKCCYICEHSAWELSDIDMDSAALYCNLEEDPKNIIFYEKVCNKFMLKKLLQF